MSTHDRLPNYNRQWLPEEFRIAQRTWKGLKPDAVEEETGKKLGNWIIDIYTGKKQLFGCRKRLFIYGQTNCNPSN